MTTAVDHKTISDKAILSKLYAAAEYGSLPMWRKQGFAADGAIEIEARSADDYIEWCRWFGITNHECKPLVLSGLTWMSGYTQNWYGRYAVVTAYADDSRTGIDPAEVAALPRDPGQTHGCIGAGCEHDVLYADTHDGHPQIPADILAHVELVPPPAGTR